MPSFFRALCLSLFIAVPFYAQAIVASPSLSSDCEESLEGKGTLIQEIKPAQLLLGRTGANITGQDLITLMKKPTAATAIAFLNKMFPKDEWIATQTSKGYDRLMKIEPVAGASPLFQASNYIQWFDKSRDNGISYINGPSRGGPSIFGIWEWVGFENARVTAFRIRPESKIKSIKFKKGVYDSGDTGIYSGPIEASNLEITVDSGSGSYQRLTLSFFENNFETVGIMIRNRAGYLSIPTTLANKLTPPYKNNGAGNGASTGK